MDDTPMFTDNEIEMMDMTQPSADSMECEEGSPPEDAMVDDESPPSPARCPASPRSS